jgi:NADP-dependent 3-hydroxy acid dehydrogenase YdfG/acyl carrier protein
LTDADGQAMAAQRSVVRVLGIVQQFLAADALTDAQLMILTQGAAPPRPGTDAGTSVGTDLPGAAVAGLIRSAQSENPGRLILADLPASSASAPASGADPRLALLLAAALASAEPEVALRDGMLLARRLTRLPATSPRDQAAPRTSGTILITGGTGSLGALTARHLAATGRARQVILASRSGPAAPATAKAAAQVAVAGAAVQVTACDAADRETLAGLLAAVPPDRPLTGVIHTAGLMDDGVITSLTTERVAAVMRPKATAAWHLHELTRGQGLQQFVVFSSVVAALGHAGQGSYAAANAFLDGLAARRRDEGLPATSIAWGAWMIRAGIGRNLTDADLARLRRGGLADMGADEGLALLDAAAAQDEAQMVAGRMDIRGLRARAARGEDVPAIWRSLTGTPVRRTAASAPAVAAAETLRQQLAVLLPTDQEQVVLDLVRAHEAAVLGHACAEGIDPGRTFREMGFDSLAAVELRNRLAAVTGLRLPATLIYRYPTPGALAVYLRSQLVGQQADYEPALQELDRLKPALSLIAADSDGRSRVLTRLEAIVREFRVGAADSEPADGEIESATDDEIFELIDKEMGI